MKAFVAALATETNCFSPFPTSLKDFERVEGGKGELAPYFQAVRSLASKRNWKVIEGLGAIAQPAGKTLQADYEILRDELLANLKSALPVDAVILALHGAMVAGDEDDCEGDILERARAIVGPNTPISVGLDSHAHLSDKMVNNADFLVFMKEWPHIDALSVVEIAFDLAADYCEGKITRPHTAVYDCAMIGRFHTLTEPMKSFVEDMRAAEELEDVLNISLVHGFDAADVPDMGTKMLVITDGNADLGRELARSFGNRLYELRGKTCPESTPLPEAIAALQKTGKKPIALADLGDVSGGGAPGDATFILKAVMEKGIEGVIFSSLWDPIAVELAKRAGQGAQLALRVGGKSGPFSGSPVDINATVKSIHTNCTFTDCDGAAMNDGDVVVVTAGGNDIVLKTKRTACMSYRPLEALGLDPKNARAIVIKSANNFYSGFQDIIGACLYVSSPGLTGVTAEELTYNRIQRPKWPLDKEFGGPNVI